MVLARRGRWSVLAAALVLAMCGLLVACGTTRVVEGEARTQSPMNPAEPPPVGADPFSVAVPGDCLAWPGQAPEMAHVVDCAEPHLFEIAEVVDLSGQFSANAPPPRDVEIRNLSQQRCQPAIRRYLGAKYDPNSRFIASLLWQGERNWRETGDRRVFCGLQEPGPDGREATVVGRVADQDQSRTWPAGTCIGVDPATRLPTDVPADCAAPHAMEVTGTVDVGAQFSGPLPAQADQDAFIKDACIKATDAYLAPIARRETTLTIIYSTIQQESWDAGSRQVACGLGAVSDAGWATLLNSAKGPLLIDGRPPAP